MYPNSLFKTNDMKYHSLRLIFDDAWINDERIYNKVLYLIKVFLHIKLCHLLDHYQNQKSWKELIWFQIDPSSKSEFTWKTNYGNFK